jgi:hypothetical protein
MCLAENDAALTLHFVIAELVPAIHRGADVIGDRARRARFALHSCCTMDCRNMSGNDSVGGVKFSPSARSDGGVPEGGGGGWCGMTAETEPRANTPSRRCLTPPSTFAKAAVDEGENVSVAITLNEHLKN